MERNYLPLLAGVRQILKNYCVISFSLKPFLSLACLICLSGQIYAQEIHGNEQAAIIARQDSIIKRDIVDVLLKGFQKGKTPTPKPIKEQKTFMTIFPAIGSTPATRLVGLVAANVAFYLGDKKTTTASVILTSISYSLNKQILFPMRTNIWLKNNSWNLIGDWRFMKYPQNTYGLGGGTTTSNKDLIIYNYIKIYESAVKNVYSKLYAGGGINIDYFYDIDDNWNKPSTDPFKSYGVGTGNKSLSTGLNASLLWDDRKNTINPEKGSYLNLVYRFYPSILGNSSGWASVYADFRKYFCVSPKKKNILALWFLYWGVPKGEAPYLLLPSNAWDSYCNTSRGYIQGRFRSKNMLYAEAEYRYKITNNGLIGGVIFANAASYSEPGSGKYKYIYPAVGAGLRVKLNKDSNTNLVIDFAMGIKHSNGFYLDVGEIF